MFKGSTHSNNLKRELNEQKQDKIQPDRGIKAPRKHLKKFTVRCHE